ncbi:MAG: hypothetical protein GQE15_21460 [Archangiaceae bacterium]|nr:hypothetical protein [Archangiaceae bacterium]
MNAKHLAVWLCVLGASVAAQPKTDGGVPKRASKQKSGALEATDVATIVNIINSGQITLPPFFPNKVDQKAVDAVSFRPGVLMGMGSMLIKFKHRADALSDSQWERLEANATRVPAESSPPRSLKDSVGQRLAPSRKVVAHLVLDGKDESEWNHGGAWGVTLLNDDAVVFWIEDW